MESTPPLGELVVRNGKPRGKRLPLGNPVTVIGRGERCDVRLNADGVIEVHCLIAMTPAGPSLRSWAAEQTLVNNEPTTAKLLKDGDEIRVGPCLFQLSFPQPDILPLQQANETESEGVRVTEQEFVALRTQVAAVAAQHAMLLDSEWQLHDRQQILHHQEAQLAQTLTERQQQLNDLQKDLIVGREQLRQEREKFETVQASVTARLESVRAKLRPQRLAILQAKKRVRHIHSRFLQRMKLRWSSERKQLEAERNEFRQQQAELELQKRQLEEARLRQSAEAAQQQDRLQQAWALIGDGQRRLLADRQAGQEAVARWQRQLAERELQLESREQKVYQEEQAATDKLHDLYQEAHGLEARTARARELLEALERRRDGLEASLNSASKVGYDPVPLDAKADQEPGKLLSELHTQMAEVERERRSLAAARSEFEKRCMELADQKTVLNEQIQALQSVQEQSLAEERQVARELETLAGELQRRELALAERDRELARLNFGFGQRHDELEQMRAKLEAWQLSLATHEIASSSARDQAQAALDHREAKLRRWQQSLTTLCHNWAELRAQEKQQLRDELARWQAACQQHLERFRALDADRAELQLAIEQVAPPTLAALETQPESWQAARQQRLLRKRWLGHFRKLRSQIEAERQLLAKEADQLIQLATRQSEALMRSPVAQQRLQAQLDQVAELQLERQLDEKSTILSIEAARAARSEAALIEVRNHVEQMAATLLKSAA